MSLYFTTLSCFEKFTARQYLKIKPTLPAPQDIWQADAKTLHMSGWSEELSHEFKKWQKENPLEKWQEILKEKNIKTISLDDQEYPPLLREIFDPPVTLFYRGTWQTEIKNVGVVGTRKMSPYAKQATWQIVSPLAKSNIGIVSGLALGVDREAHEAALSEKGYTVAVLGGSVEKNNIYPTFNNQLAEKIIQNGGLVVSEYPPGFFPTLFSFPMRNRIIAGLSHGVLVIEAPEKSGSLITARAALDTNREVFCLPHQINMKNGAGGNKLVQSGGGGFIIDHTDILNILGWENLTTNQPDMNKTKFDSLTPKEQKIIELISEEPRHVEEIIKLSSLPAPEVLGIISIMEINGLIKNDGNKIFKI